MRFLHLQSAPQRQFLEHPQLGAGVGVDLAPEQQLSDFCFDSVSDCILVFDRIQDKIMNRPSMRRRR